MKVVSFGKYKPIVAVFCKFFVATEDIRANPGARNLFTFIGNLKRSMVGASLWSSEMSNGFGWLSCTWI